MNGVKGENRLARHICIIAERAGQLLQFLSSFLFCCQYLLSLYLGIIITSDLSFLFYTASEVYTISKGVSLLARLKPQA